MRLLPARIESQIQAIKTQLEAIPVLEWLFVCSPVSKRSFFFQGERCLIT